jgi:hypothetical protein
MEKTRYAIIGTYDGDERMNLEILDYSDNLKDMLKIKELLEKLDSGNNKDAVAELDCLGIQIDVDNALIPHFEEIVILKNI